MNVVVKLVKKTIMLASADAVAQSAISRAPERQPFRHREHGGIYLPEHRMEGCAYGDGQQGIYERCHRQQDG